jgi:hypothetical protein
MLNHKHDVFSYKHLIEVLGRQDNVTIIDATEDLFLDCRKSMDQHYNSFKSGTINKNHIFQCDDYDATGLDMKCRTHDGSEEAIQSMPKRGVERSEERLQAMEDFKMETLKLPVLRPIKQVELFKNLTVRTS